MFNQYRQLLFAWLFAGLVGLSNPFFIAPTRRVFLKDVRSTCILAKHSEFAVVGEDEELPEDVAGSDYMVIQKAPESETSTSSGDVGSGKKRAEYGALAAGTVVQVQVGDISLARKAWKKRRRTGSPLLVPCSILNVDQRSMIRWNLIFLLEKFGKAKTDGVQITVSELAQRYRTFLRSSMQKHAIALGYESNDEMVSDLFNKKVQESYGIRLITKSSGQVSLKAPISRMKAQKRAAGTPVVQFRDHKTGDYGDADTLTHTGFVRTRRPDQDPTDRSYHFLPLSAALRVSQKDDIETGHIEEGSIHSAVVFDYDLLGDAGSPLLTLSLNPRGVREKLKVKPDRKFQPIENPQVEFKDLKVGNGPYKAKVVRLLKGRALVDMDVGRKTSSEGLVRVLGALPYKESVETLGQQRGMPFDAYDEDDDDFDFHYGDDLDDDLVDSLFNFDDEDDFEDDDDSGSSMADELLSLRSDDSFEEGTFEDGEEEEDVSDLYALNEDGTLSYTDPTTGETVVMGSVDDDEEDEDESDDDADATGDEDDLDFDATALFEQNEDGSMSFIDPDSGEALDVQQGDEEFEDMMMIKSLIDKYSTPPSPKNVDYTYSAEQTEDAPKEPVPHPAPKLISKRLKVGEEIDVYVRSVSKQNGQFAVTMNPTVKGRKAKELKKESGAMKKLDRLKKSLGGSLQKIFDLEGHECSGTVKATSNTGEWVYVQPHLDGLPVGVATIDEEHGTATIGAGDSVRVRIAGVDEQRGQLAMQLLGKE